jgi:hypothetical protein
VSRPWWQDRDPDLGRDRETKTLGRRAWDWFSTYDGSTTARADVEQAHSPWAGHSFTAKDRHDRTLGIPAREVSMWPHHQPTLEQPAQRSAVQDARRQRANRIIEDLRAIPDPPSPTDIPPTLLAELLTELAPLVYARSPTEQISALSEVAHRYEIPPTTLLALARDTGTMIAKTTHQPPPDVPGEASLNRLLHADLSFASELLLARARLAWAATHSDPDLPRLWILANALHHGISAQVVFTEPAHSSGPLARVIPRHDDLVGWHGIRAALDHLEATVHAVEEARQWLPTAADSAHNRLLALGILHLSHPRSAYQLTRDGPAAIQLADLRYVAGRLPAPKHVIDLADAALKAACDRNNWLLGTADERTQRELVERRLPAALTDDVRARLAAGDTRALTEAITREAPTDLALDRANWRHDPPALDAEQRRQLLDVASREALHRFAGLEIHPHRSKAAAIVARFPDRLAGRGFRAYPDQLLRADQASTTEATPPRLEQQFEIDLGK